MATWLRYNAGVVSVLLAVLLAMAGPGQPRAQPPPLRALTDQDLIAYARSPLETTASPRSFYLGALGGFPVEVDLYCAAACPAGEVRIVQLTGYAEAGRSCQAVGGVWIHRAMPGRRFGGNVCAPRSVWFTELFDTAPVFSDRQLADYATAEVDPDHVPDRGTVVASYRGALVRVEFPCQSACGTPRVIYLDPPPGKSCADVGGEVTTIVIPEDFGTRQLDYCVPKVVADAEAQKRP
jgi:hypothetical protein